MDLKTESAKDTKSAEKAKENTAQEPALFMEKQEQKHKGWRWVIWIIGISTVVFFLWPKGVIKGDAVLQASKFVRLDVSSPGILRDLFYEKGAYVKKGTVIARFENPDITKTLEEKKERFQTAIHEKARLESRLELLQKEKGRVSVLYENGAASAALLEKADFEVRDTDEALAGKKQEIESLQIEIRLLEQRIEAFTVKAPFDGLLLGDPKDRLGGFFKEGDLLLEMADPTSYFLEVLVLEKDIKKIALGDKVKARFYVSPRTEITGEVTRVAPRIIEQVEKVFKVRRVIPCEITLKNIPPNIRYGMQASVSIDTQSHNQLKERIVT